MDKRSPYENHSGVTLKNTFLLGDLVYCGYCGKKLKTKINKNTHEIPDQRDFGAEKQEEISISLLADVINKGTFSIEEKGIKQEKESCLREIEMIKEELSQLYSSYFEVKKENQLPRIAKLEKDILELNKKFLRRIFLICDYY
jgi:predicted acetyltransferase